MSDYFANRGRFSHHMMKSTGALQICIDFFSETDFARKFRLSNQLCPVIYAVFDNCPVFEGETDETFCRRTDIWENTDSDRCSTVPTALDPDFGYSKYAEYLLDIIPIVIPRSCHPCEIILPKYDAMIVKSENKNVIKIIHKFLILSINSFFAI